MIADLLNRACTITKGVDSDGYGLDILDDADLIDTVCELQQRNRSEAGDAGEISLSDWVVFLPAGTDLRTADKITVDGETFEVIGEPWPARNPRTQLASHVEATVRRTGA